MDDDRLIVMIAHWVMRRMLSPVHDIESEGMVRRVDHV
jgi:hypothetical protein